MLEGIVSYFIFRLEYLQIWGFSIRIEEYFIISYFQLLKDYY